MMEFVYERVGNNVGKEENARYQNVLRLPHCFQKVFVLGLIKSQECIVKI